MKFTKLTQISEKSREILLRYPMVLVSALLASVAMCAYAVTDIGATAPPFVFLRFTIVAALGISLFFATHLLEQRLKIHYLSIFPAIFLVGFYFLLPDKQSEFTEVYAYVLIPVFLLSHLLVSFIGYIFKNKQSNFWYFNKSLFINAVLIAIFTAVMTGGMLLAVVAVDQLFDLHLNDNYYSCTLFSMLFFGSASIFLLFGAEGLEKLESDREYPQVLKFFVQYILIPLLLLYAVILFAYVCRILLRWELPRGWVSYLVMIYCTVGIFATLLVHPLRGRSEKSWVNLFSKIFFYTVLPLLVLLYVAIFTRILEYGYTEPRYFLLASAVWVTVVTVYNLAWKDANSKFVPISLFCIGIFALATPLLNAFAVAKRSQLHQLEIIIKTEKVLNGSKINFKKTISGRTANDIADKYAFLSMRGKAYQLRKYLDPETQKLFDKKIEAGDYYGVNPLIRDRFVNTINPEEPNKIDSRYTTFRSTTVETDISSYDYLFKVYHARPNTFAFAGNTMELKLAEFESETPLELTFNGKNVDVKNDFKRLFQPSIKGAEVQLDIMEVVKIVDNYELRIMLGSVLRRNDGASRYSFLVNEEPVIILVRKLQNR